MYPSSTTLRIQLLEVTFLHWCIKKGSLAASGILVFVFGFGLVGVVGVVGVGLSLLKSRSLVVVLSVVTVVVVVVVSFLEPLGDWKTKGPFPLRLSCP